MADQVNETQTRNLSRLSRELDFLIPVFLSS